MPPPPPLPPLQAFGSEPRAQLWYADLGAWPELSPGLHVDASLLSLELPSVLLLAPDGAGGRGAKRLPLKAAGSGGGEGGEEEGGAVRTVRMSAGNMRRFFAVGGG